MVSIHLKCGSGFQLLVLVSFAVFQFENSNVFYIVHVVNKNAVTIIIPSAVHPRSLGVLFSIKTDSRS